MGFVVELNCAKHDVRLLVDFVGFGGGNVLLLAMAWAGYAASSLPGHASYKNTPRPAGSRNSSAKRRKHGDNI